MKKLTYLRVIVLADFSEDFERIWKKFQIHFFLVWNTDIAVKSSTNA